MKKQIYNTDIYVRLSREDGDKIESDSISNQKQLIKNYIASRPEFKLNKIRIDDGYTGVNFDRPAFIEMLSDIKEGKVNCVIVKDLSRFGRNYIESGKYITNIFPFLGVRFIAINDGFDTANIQNSSEMIFLHFKNLMNDAYCNDTSIKVRSHLNIKCKRGDFISAYAPYGYLKSPENKNKLIVDESVRGVIEDIFKWKISGMSAMRIADKLNSLGIASPMEHKKELGINFKSAFKKNPIALWNAKSVTRILTNRIYTGTLEQSKSTTPNYKIKTRIYKPTEEWIVVENNHEPIIDRSVFDTTAKLLSEDTRTAPGKDNVYIFSGILKCGKCGGNMTRKVVASGKKKFVYYICLNNKNKCGCDSKVNFPVNKLENIVIETINERIYRYIELKKMIETISAMPYGIAEIKRLQAEAARIEKDAENSKRHRLELYEDLKSGLIDNEDYKSLHRMYSERIEKFNDILTNLQREISLVLQENEVLLSSVKSFAESGVFTELTKEDVILLVNKIFIYDKDRIEIVFNFQSDMDLMENFVKACSGTEAV